MKATRYNAKSLISTDVLYSLLSIPHAVQSALVPCTHFLVMWVFECSCASLVYLFILIVSCLSLVCFCRCLSGVILHVWSLFVVLCLLWVKFTYWVRSCWARLPTEPCHTWSGRGRRGRRRGRRRHTSRSRPSAGSTWSVGPAAQSSRSITAGRSRQRDRLWFNLG